MRLPGDTADTGEGRTRERVRPSPISVHGPISAHGAVPPPGIPPPGVPGAPPVLSRLTTGLPEPAPGALSLLPRTPDPGHTAGAGYEARKPPRTPPPRTVLSRPLSPAAGTAC
ncbi:hypothetical protein GCM10011583_29660 [Streptomyces camponoticapitis]|uniref:Uncharacterized protein n=1 Tax=Streptomyces camponoticapitis TaxID=1616125 RepID=A0ABQ2E4Y9_9ACTN|nr:hypothetical protein GCM10011583_29660 [Streptomyces camponoticapitis]